MDRGSADKFVHGYDWLGRNLPELYELVTE